MNRNVKKKIKEGPAIFLQSSFLGPTLPPPSAGKARSTRHIEGRKIKKEQSLRRLRESRVCEDEERAEFAKTKREQCLRSIRESRVSTPQRP